MRVKVIARHPGFERRSKQITLERTIVEEGVVLYAKP